MKQLTKIELAELIIYADNIHDILFEYDFKQEMKFEFNKIDKSVKKLIKLAFGNTDLTDLDEYKIKNRVFCRQLIKDKVELS